MLAIFLKTLPFFAVIGLGFMAGRQRFFTPEATAYLTKFVFYFALSAMLFGFAAAVIVGFLLTAGKAWTGLAEPLAIKTTAAISVVNRDVGIPTNEHQFVRKFE